MSAIMFTLLQDKWRINKKIARGRQDIYSIFMTFRWLGHVLFTSSGAASRVIVAGGPEVTFTLTNSSKFWYLKHTSREPGEPSTKRMPVTTTDPVLDYIKTHTDTE